MDRPSRDRATLGGRRVSRKQPAPTEPTLAELLAFADEVKGIQDRLDRIAGRVDYEYRQTCAGLLWHLEDRAAKAALAEFRAGQDNGRADG